jgi:hypothetical protein
MLKRLRRWLMKNYPLSRPVRIIRVHKKTFIKSCGNDCFGDAELRKDHFLIRINKTVKDEELPTWLIHEWCHCLLWHTPKQIMAGDHCELFSLVNGRIYKNWIGEE